MPTYEYACKDCGEHLEVVQSFKDDPLTTCPSCQGSLRKVFSAAGLIFKGSGWHIKDYKSTSSGTTAGTSTAPEKAGSDSSSSETSSSSSSSESSSSSSKTTESSSSTATQKKSA